MAAPLLLTSDLAKCETVLHDCGTSPVCLSYAIDAVCQLYHGGDMVDEMRKKSESALSPLGELCPRPVNSRYLMRRL